MSALAPPRSVARRAYGRGRRHGLARSAPARSRPPGRSPARRGRPSRGSRTRPRRRTGTRTRRARPGAGAGRSRYRTPSSSRNGVRKPVGPPAPSASGPLERRQRSRRCAVLRVQDGAGGLGGRALERLRGAGHRGRGLDQLAGELPEEPPPAEVDLASGPALVGRPPVGTGAPHRRRTPRRLADVVGRLGSAWGRSMGRSIGAASLRDRSVSTG